jgi:hypothetical protein
MKKIVTRKPKEQNIIKLKKYLSKYGRSKNIRVNK